MTEITPLDGRAWRERRALVPTGGPREGEELSRSLPRDQYEWSVDEEAFPLGGRYVVVVAVRGSDPSREPRYFALALPEEYEAGRAVGRALAAPLAVLERALAPLGRRLGGALRDTAARFISLEDLAAETGVSREAVEGWRREPDFPPAVLERGGNPLFVREEVEAWLDAHG